MLPEWPWSAEDLRALRAHVPGPPSLPRFEFVRFFIGVLAVLLACWYFSRQMSDSAAIVGEADVTEADLRHALSQMPGSRRLWVWLALMVVFTLVYIGLRPDAFDRHALLTMVLPMVSPATNAAA